MRERLKVQSVIVAVTLLVLISGCSSGPNPGEGCSIEGQVSCGSGGAGLVCTSRSWDHLCDECSADDGWIRCEVTVCIAEAPEACGMGNSGTTGLLCIDCEGLLACAPQCRLVKAE